MSLSQLSNSEICVKTTTGNKQVNKYDYESITLYLQNQVVGPWISFLTPLLSLYIYLYLVYLIYKLLYGILIYSSIIINLYISYISSISVCLTCKALMVGAYMFQDYYVFFLNRLYHHIISLFVSENILRSTLW